MVTAGKWSTVCSSILNETDVTEMDDIDRVIDPQVLVNA